MKSINFSWIYFLPIIAISIGKISCNQKHELGIPNNALIDISIFSKDQNLSRGFYFIDCRHSTHFLKGHIPGAININRSDVADQFSMLLDKKSIITMLSELGISTNSQLILYDDNGSVEAARIWWVLNFYGMKKLHIIDGGLDAWKSRGLDISTNLKRYKPVKPNFSTQNDSTIFADIIWIENAIRNPEIKILDSRSESEYSGQELKEGALYPGHIPGSIHMDYMELIDFSKGSDKRLKTEAELRILFLERGIYPTDTIVTYCHSGVRSSLMTFVLKNVLKYPNVRNYSGSWIEWARLHPPKKYIPPDIE
jgi:thiosulfate/3-mercaptopyruvate sulfurtransferase